MRCPSYLTSRAFLSLHGAGRVVDVRSPSEFAQAHIPGAVNVPLFNDEERAEVGTLYKNRGRDAAIARGFQLVGPKLEALRQRCLSHVANGCLRMHCWRGGMRSESMAWLLARSDVRVYLLHGGYKAYRQYVLESFEIPYQLVVLGGFTGSGKTDVIHSLAALGEQTIDLERYAHHKGSAFGWLGESPQPSGEQFENELHAHLASLDRRIRIWVEDESRNIGKIFIPSAFHAQMQTGRKVFIHTSETSRIERLLRDYTNYPKEEIITAIKRLTKRLGSEAVTRCTDAVLNDDYVTAIRLVLSYYDKRYAYAMESKSPHHAMLEMETLTPEAIASQLVAWADTNSL